MIHPTHDTLSHTDHLCLLFVTCSKGRKPFQISSFFPHTFFPGCLTLIVAFMCRFMQPNDISNHKLNFAFLMSPFRCILLSLEQYVGYMSFLLIVLKSVSFLAKSGV